MSRPRLGAGLSLALAAATGLACVGLKDGSVLPPDASATVAPVGDTGAPPALPAEASFGDEPLAGADAGSAVDPQAGAFPGDADAPTDVTTDDANAPTDAPADSPADAVDAPAEAPPVTPASIEAAHLRLWLTADHGITCTDGRVVSWADQSGRHDDAITAQGQLGPRCGTGHEIGGIDVPFFSAPENDAAPNAIDETLDVDLGFLAGSDYTLFVVERRWADGDASTPEVFLGTTQPDPSAGCGGQKNDALVFGYVWYYGTGETELLLDQSCNDLHVPVNPLDVSPPGPVTEDTAEYRASSGHAIWVGGLSVASNGNLQPLVSAQGGAIGRAIVSTLATNQDWRFKGDLAEVLVYDVGLSETERLSVEAYLRAHWNY